MSWQARISVEAWQILSAMTLDPSYLSDADRLRVLAVSHLMDSMPEPAFDRFVRLAAAITGSPTALVSLVDDERQYFKAHMGLPEPWASRRQTPLTHSFCQYVVTGGQSLVVEDARSHPLVKDNLAITEIGVESYLGAPLRLDGHCMGSLCVIDGKSRAWTAQDIEALEDLAKVITTEMELRRQSFQLDQARKQAEAANQATGEFFTRASHELRTPLQGILGATELALFDDSVIGRPRQMMEVAHSSARDMVRLVEDLLELHQLSREPLEVRLDEVHLDERFARLEAEFSDTARCPSFLVSGLDTPVEADWDKVRQILLALIDNALRYTNGSVEVRVAPSQDRLHLEVVDHGQGISADNLERVFEPFGRLQEGAGGAGLGLAIARRLAQLMDGSLSAHSVVGKGTTFLLDLPLLARSQSDHPTGPGLPPRLRVLVVDDHELNLELFEFLLHSLGQDVVTASSGQEGLRLALEGDFDVILLDLNMPGLNGFEVLARLVPRPGQRVLAMSAAAVHEVSKRCAEAGFDGALPKPVSRQDLSRALFAAR